MSTLFIDNLASTALDSEDPDAIQAFLLSLSDQIEVLQFSTSEWKSVNEKIVSEVIPALSNHVKDWPGVIKDALDFFRAKLISKDLEQSHWLEYFNIASKAFHIGTTNKVRVGGLEVIQSLFSNKGRNEIEQGKLHDFVRNGLIGSIARSSRPSPSLVKEINITLGLLCEFETDLMAIFEKDVRRYLMSQLLEQIRSTVAKLDITILDGCFRGLDHFLKAFTISDVDEHYEELYIALLKSSEFPEDGGRRYYRRSALELFVRHSKLWQNRVINDCTKWLENLIRWARSGNSDDHKLGWRCLIAFLKTITNQQSQKNERAFSILDQKFRHMIENGESKKEIILGIIGFGYLAKVRPKDEVDEMLEKLISKTQEVFFTSKEEKEEWLAYYPDHIKAIANVMHVLGDELSVETVLEIEDMALQLIIDFPKFPPQHQGFAIEAFQDVSNELDLKNLVMKGLIHSCSFPLVIDTDLDSEVTSTKSYLRFWRTLANIKLVNDALIQSIIDIIEKLNFQTDTFEVIFNEANEEVSKTLETPLTQVIKEESDTTEGLVKKVKKPRKIKDHTILANLVIIFDIVKDLDSQWQTQILKTLMAKSTEFPEVSSFYKLFSKTIKMSKDIFEQNEKLFKTVIDFLAEAIDKCQSFEHELLTSFLKLIAQLPMAFIKKLLQYLSLPMIKVFKQKQNLPLVEQGIIAIEAWTKEIGHDAMKDFFVQVIPKMRLFLDGENLQLLEESGKLKSESKKSVEVVEDPLLNRIQMKIMFLFGKLDSNLHYLLLPSQEELSAISVAWSREQRLDFDIPFPDLNCKIHLDKLLPRVIDLSLNSTHRRTRVAACETLHVLVIYMIGKEATHSDENQKLSMNFELYAKVFPVILKLAGDEDSVIGSCLFDKLMIQIVHQLTRPHKGQFSKGVIVLIDSILDALCDPEDKILRDTAKRMLHEYLKWSIKQNCGRSEADENKSAKLLITRLYSMWVHSSYEKRKAASMAFNSFYTIFREQEALVDIYTIEVFVHVMKSLEMSHGRDCEEHKDCINHLVRILGQKKEIFEKPSSKRRRPLSFGECSGTLSDLVQWLIPWVAKRETEARHKSMEVLFYLCRESIKDETTKNGMDKQLIEKVNRKVLEDDQAYFEKLLASIEVAVWLIQCEIAPLKSLQLDMEDFDPIGFFETFQDTPKRESEMKMVVGAIVVKYLEFLTIGKRFSENDLCLIKCVLLHPSKVGFDARHQAKLRSEIRPLIASLDKDFLSSSFKEAFDKEFTKFIGNKIDQDSLETLQSLNSLKKFSKVMNVQDLDIIVKAFEKHLEKSREVCIEMIQLLCSYQKDLLKKCLANSKILKNCDTVIFLLCLDSNFKDLQEALPIHVLARFVRFMTTKNGNSVKKWAQDIMENWMQIVSEGKPKLSIHLCKYLSQVNPQLHQNVKDWFFDFLESTNQLKTRLFALDLLQVFPKEDSEIERCLSKIAKEFPSDEFKKLDSKGSSLPFDFRSMNELRKGYFIFLNKIILALEKTSNKSIFLQLLKIFSAEDNHSHQERLRKCLQNVKGKLELLNLVFDYVFGANQFFDIRKSKRISDVLVNPLLEGSSNFVMLNFFSKVIKPILESILEGNETQKVISIKMVGLLYTKATKDVVHGKGSMVTREAFEFLKTKANMTKGDYSGKEMSQFLVKTLKEIRKNPQVSMITRCEAYNTMMSVFTCIQDDEKYYYNFLFKEDKDTILWERIIDVDEKWTFPIESEDIPQKRKEVVAIRKASKSEAAKVFKSHFLADSSLSQEVVSFDFTDSIISQVALEDLNNEGQKANDHFESMNFVELEKDSIGSNPCFAPLIGLLHFMKTEEILKESETLQGTIKSLKEKLSDSGTKANIKLFILKLILNCNDIFKPYCKDFVGVILRTITKKTTWNESPIINYLSLDILVMLSDWPCIPNGDQVERNQASESILLLAEAAKNAQSREIMRYCLDLAFSLIEKWKTCLVIDYVRLQSLFSDQSDFTKNNVGIQILGYLIANGIAPCIESDARKAFFKDLSMNMESKKKEVSQATAEVLGLAIKAFKEKKNNTSFEIIFNITRDHLKKMNKSSQTREKFYHSLYMVFQHYPEIVEEFASHFVYNLSMLPKGGSLRQCVEMLQGALNYFKENVSTDGSWKKELEMTKIRNFLQGKDCNGKVQLASLSFIESALDELLNEPDLIQSLLLDFKPLMSHPMTEIRSKVHEILQTLCLKNVKNALEIILIGLDDPDNSISNGVVDFIKNNYLKRMNQTTEMIKFLLENALKPSSKDAFLNVFCDLTLAHTESSPRLKSLLFEHPLDKIAFAQVNVDPSWRSQFQHDVHAPMFAETLASTQASMSSQGSTSNMILATQTDFEFSPTQASTMTTQKRKQNVFMSSIVNTQASIEPGQFKVPQSDESFGKPMNVQHGNEPLNEQNSRSIRIGRRFGKVENQQTAQENTKVRFAKRHLKKMNRVQILEQERKGRRHAQVMMKRSYREGDLPDIQITSEDILKPLRFLCYRDNVISEILGTLMFSGIIGKEDQALKNLVISKALETKANNRHLGKCLLETCLSCFESKEIDAFDEDRLVLMAKKFGLESIAILLLEKKTKKTRSESKVRRTINDQPRFEKETVFALINLYKSLGDQSSSKGIYLQEIPQIEIADEAIKAFDSMSRPKDVRNCHKILMEKEQDEKLKEFWTENYLISLEKLCAWEDIDQFRNSEIESSNVKKHLSIFMNAANHLQIEDRSKINVLYDLFKTLTDDEKKNFNLESASLFKMKKKESQAERCIGKFSEVNLQAWINKSPYQVDNAEKIIKSMQMASNFIQVPDEAEIKRQLSTDLKANDDLVSQLRILKKLKVCEISKIYFDCLEIAQDQKRMDVCMKLLKCLKNTDESLQSSPMFIKFKMKAEIEACTDQTKKRRNDKTFSNLYRILMGCQSDMFQKLALNDQVSVKSCILQELSKLLGPNANFQETLNWLTSSSSEESDKKKHHFRKLIGNQTESVEFALRKKSVEELHFAYETLDHKGLLMLTKSCYDLVQSFPESINDEIILCTLQSHVKSIRLGLKEAMKLFPKILNMMEDHVKPHLNEQFQEALESLPPWTVLPWSNQILALLENERLSKVILPMIVKMAETHSQALWFAFNFIKKDVQEKFPRLSRLLKPPIIIQRIIQALRKLSLPSIRVSDFMANLATADDPRVLLDEFLKDNFEDQTNLEKRCFTRDFKNVLETLVKKLQKTNVEKEKKQLCNEAKEKLVKEPSKLQVNKLSDFSKFLADFNANDHEEKMDIPGQYDMKYEDTRHKIKISGFQDSIVIFQSIRKPIKIILIGDDGKDYPFIIKCGEDIRQDQRIEQVFNICNNLAQGSMVTYNVIPINNSLGMIEFVPNTSTLQSLVPESNAKIGVESFGKLQNSLKLAKNSSISRKEFEDQVAGKKFALKDAFLKNSMSFEGFFHLRKNFMVSHGEVCIVGYLLGIGDRHASNMLINLLDGRSIAIDFGYAFGYTFFLPIPELVPFRLTPMIQGLIYPFKEHGIFKDSMISILQRLKGNSDILMSALSLFVKEPNMNWPKEHSKLDRIEIVQRKLNGEDPCKIIATQLEKYYATRFNKPELLKDLNNLISEHQITEEEFSYEKVVTALIRLASDGAILSRAFVGWKPQL